MKLRRVSLGRERERDRDRERERERERAEAGCEPGSSGLSLPSTGITSVHHHARLSFVFKQTKTLLNLRKIFGNSAILF